jgi:ribosomal subunit interface protein
MDIRVSGHQIDTGAALQEHASDRLSTIVEKHFSRALSSTVTFGKAPASAFAADIVLHVSHGLILKSHGQAQDAHVAFDQAAEKIEKQLRRYKRRLKDRHEQTAHAAREEDAAYTIFGPIEQIDSEEETEVDAPAVIAETRVDIPEVSVADAVMMLDLRHTNALFFKNAGTGRHNMVYRRNDGSIGWVEPS